jgi:hypothetical protein
MTTITQIATMSMISAFAFALGWTGNGYRIYGQFYHQQFNNPQLTVLAEKIRRK